MLNVSINNKDKEILRSLAGRMAELAARPCEKQKRELWYMHNSLAGTRPVIFCDPENGWNEIIAKEQLLCGDELSRQWEYRIRREIFWGESMGDDRVVEPYFDISHVYTESDWGMHETRTGGEKGGAYHWDAPLKVYCDLDKLHFPKIDVDYIKTEKLLAFANDIFGDLLKVRLKTSWWWTMGLTWTLVNLRGLEQIMYDMYDYPDELHRLMSIIRDGYMAKLDYLEREGLLGLNNDGTYVGSGGFGYSSELPQKNHKAEKVRTIDMWGFAESQETSQVSPEMFEEFVFQYQLPLLERFGMNCYGCCEALDKRWHIVKNAPRLRRISVSPWANLETMAGYLGKNYIFSMKPNPADIAVSHIDEDYIRKKLRNSLQIARNNVVEIIMKDNNTIGHNPNNVIRWCKIAREEIERL